MKTRNILIFVLLFILVAGTSGFLVYYFLLRDTGSTIPETCPDRPFTSYPVEMDKLKSITPLGNLNPPGHTFPTDHMYFNVDSTLNPEGFEVYAPGNMTLTSISKVEYDPPQGGIVEDFTINFAVCSHLSGRFGHINNLSTSILDSIDEFGEEYGDEVWEWDVAGRHYIAYNKEVNLKVHSGFLLGRSGLAGGYDFWLKDDRVVLDWVNNDWTKEFQHTVCPLVYFIDPLKTVLETKVLTYGGTPTDPPGYCGKIDFDIPDTAQGIWVREGWDTRVEDNGLALVYNNFNASQGAISIGYALNSSWDSRVYYFNPTNSGFMNRNFSQITNDGNIYYYLCEGFGWSGSYYKVVMIKMIGNQELLLQVIESSSPLPNDPTPLFDELLAVRYYR
ncbi:MAG: hypothetical protein GF308_09170 [Candidatus Heimdallarchaeota archaeon]|nr:hypothetical protein [Candidatus Heimdallarchaeota archaeon]